MLLSSLRFLALQRLQVNTPTFRRFAVLLTIEVMVVVMDQDGPCPKTQPSSHSTIPSLARPTRSQRRPSQSRQPADHASSPVWNVLDGLSPDRSPAPLFGTTTTSSALVRSAPTSPAPPSEMVHSMSEPLLAGDGDGDGDDG